MNGRIAQSVERWSNKPLVKGSSPFVTTFFFVVPKLLILVPDQRKPLGFPLYCLSFLVQSK